MPSKKPKESESQWVEVSAKEFLGLSETEAVLIDVRISLALTLKDRRIELGLSQTEAAKRIGSSQSRLAKMEAADPSVTIDLIIRGLLKFGSTPEDIAQAIAPTTNDEICIAPRVGVQMTHHRQKIPANWAAQPTLPPVLPNTIKYKSANGWPA